MAAPLDTTGRRLTDEQRIAWLQLIRSENVGPRAFRDLLNHFGGAAAALEALPELARRGGALLSPRVFSRQQAEAEIAALERLGARLVALGEPEFPVVLAAADGAAPLIALQGSADVLALPAVAIVGARNASAAGRSFALRLAQDLGSRGFCVVSGLARGVDATAHEAALRTGTVACLAGGLDRIYPPENEPLLARILDHGGAAITEMPLGWEPRARDFPRRNRVIAGLSRAVVVVEAALRSGSLITARLALEMGREVMAAPGSPLDPRCEGSNRLLRDGATLITSADHVVEALEPILREALPVPPEAFLSEDDDDPTAALEHDDSARARIEELLGPSPAAVDDVVRLSGQPVRLVLLVLLELELAGRLERLPGNRVARKD